MGGQKATSQRIEQFRSDAGLLSKTLQLNEMAKRLELRDAAYLGRCINGDKNPGTKFLDRFYAALEPDIAKLKDAAASMTNRPLSWSLPEQEFHETEEQPQAYERTDYQNYIQILKDNNLDLRNNLGIMIKNNEILVLSNQKLIEAQLLLIGRLSQLGK